MIQRNKGFDELGSRDLSLIISRNVFCVFGCHQFELLTPILSDVCLSLLVELSVNIRILFVSCLFSPNTPLRTSPYFRRRNCSRLDLFTAKGTRYFLKIILFLFLCKENKIARPEIPASASSGPVKPSVYAPVRSWSSVTGV